MTNSFTLGPWAWERYVFDNNHLGVVHVFVDNERGSPSICKLVGQNREANARLISEAPDMYALLRTVVAAHEAGYLKETDPESHLIEDIESCIRKVKEDPGEQNG